MLSPEHVRVRRRGNELQLLALSGDLRARAVDIAAELCETARAYVGKSREELENAWDGVQVAPRERKLLLGLEKLVEDASEFEAGDADHAAELRRELFTLAAERRKGEDVFERERVLEELATRRGTSAAALESQLYADLRGAQRLVACRAPAPAELVSAYERAQVQAVLLRAVRVVAEVKCASGDGYRALFRQLKFRRLLHRASPLDAGGYRIEIDGPFSLFQSVAKYGLELALVLPALEACDKLSLKAEVRWSERARGLTFNYAPAPQPKALGAAQTRDEVSELREGLLALESEFAVRAAERILDLPGIGVCVPDLVLQRADGTEVFVEVLGFWSRASVWQRIELARRGLGARVLFVVSSRLRVSEELLEADDEAALYVYKGHINPRAVLRHVETLVAR